MYTFFNPVKIVHVFHFADVVTADFCSTCLCTSGFWNKSLTNCGHLLVVHDSDPDCMCHL